MPIILALVLIIGILLGSKLQNNNYDKKFFIHPEPNKFNTILNYIEEEYVDSVSKSELVEKIIPDMLAELDPHSIYIPARDLKRTNEPLEGNFDGIGIQFNIQRDTVFVVNPIPKGPSEKVGILAGDRIVYVDDSLIAGTGITNNSVMKMLRGKQGTKVKLGIKRKQNKEVINFVVTRDKIPLYSVDVAYMVSEDIGYIKISKFSRTTFDEFISAIEELQSAGLKKLILDLRNNSGGYMNAAINIADQFLNSNKLIVYTQGKARPKNKSFSTSSGLCLNTELTILIDEFSASASEILAGAIQDNDRGTIIGRRSYGKGLVQEQTIFHDGSALRLTIARYYTPTGRCIQKSYENGNSDYYHDINNRYDNGEFSQADSIQLPDSLKYYTPKGKVVYGGGGIMPDNFVSMDTIRLSPYFTKLINKGLMYQFAFKYVDDNRHVLSELSGLSDLIFHLEKENIFQIFLAFAKEKSVSGTKKDIKMSEKLINTRISAFIARNIFNDIGFYPIINEEDKTVLKAVEILKAE